MAVSEHVIHQYIATFVVNICSVAYGIFLGWPSVVQPMLQSDDPPVGDKPFSNTVFSWLGALPFISSMLGNLFWGRVADKFGRKVTGCVSIMPNIICYVLMLSTENQTIFMLARFLGGFTNSAVASNTPMYIGEISEVRLRAKLASLYMLFANIGVLFVYVLGSFVSFRALNWSCLGVSVLFLLLFVFLPDSPVCLLKMNKQEKARKCVIWYRGEDEEYVNAEIKRFNDSFVRARKFSMKHLLKRTTLKGIIIGFGLQAGIQLSGISIILTYTVNIFKQSGSNLSPNNCTIIVGLMELIGSIFSSTFIEIAGRKKILCGTYLVMMIALFTLGTCFYLQDMGTGINVGYIPLISLSSYMLAYPFGAGTIPYIMYSELFASEVKNIAMSFITFWNNFLAFCTVKVFPTVFMEILHLSGCFWFFSFCTLAAIIFIILVVPETKNRSLMTVLQKLNGGRPLKETIVLALHKAENGFSIQDTEMSVLKENGILKTNNDEELKTNGEAAATRVDKLLNKTSEKNTDTDTSKEVTVVIISESLKVKEVKIEPEIVGELKKPTRPAKEYEEIKLKEPSERSSTLSTVEIVGELKKPTRPAKEYEEIKLKEPSEKSSTLSTIEKIKTEMATEKTTLVVESNGNHGNRDTSGPPGKVNGDM